MHSQQELNKVLCYTPSTGVFTWLRVGANYSNSSAVIKCFNTRQAGKRAGCIGVNGYRHICYQGKMYQASRLAWLFTIGSWPADEIDHKDGNPANDRIANLRAVTPAENRENMCLRSDNKTGLAGVFFDKTRCKWEASIKENGKKKHLGRVGDFFEACCLWISAQNTLGYTSRHGKVRQ